MMIELTEERQEQGWETEQCEGFNQRRSRSEECSCPNGDRFMSEPGGAEQSGVQSAIAQTSAQNSSKFSSVKYSPVPTLPPGLCQPTLLPPAQEYISVASNDSSGCYVRPCQATNEGETGPDELVTAKGSTKGKI